MSHTTRVIVSQKEKRNPRVKRLHSNPSSIQVLTWGIEAVTLYPPLIMKLTVASAQPGIKQCNLPTWIKVALSVNNLNLIKEE